MGFTQHAQFLAHSGNGISNLFDRALQFIWRDAELPGPGVNFNRLAHCDMASGVLVFANEIVTHVESSDENDPA
jgi:hypothetical protein